ncbi:unnamed protein product [Clonostachys rosea f. rosea IK726]|uniref:Uncharacterized protein n=1 Tax=Clonostachys rosea f. rosea IK726 TaxID=1349383 RepID=A0ACA9UKX8_BIOOC|nr:unnamed protein product [Clonostachys rosea f. rosea IK726]
MADLPLDPKLPTNNERHAEVPQPAPDPDPEVLQPSTWAPTSDEERRIFRVWKEFTLAERNKDTLSWNTPTPQSYESKGTQNAELHLWKAHGYWDPSGRRSTPSQKKGGKRVLASISDFMGLKRSDPKDQALANSLIKRFDRGEFQKLIVNWIVESQQSFKQAEHPRLQQIFEYLNPAIKVTSAHITAKTVHRLAVQQFDRYHSTVQEVLNRSPGRKFPPCLEESSFLNENDWAVLRTFDEILSDFHVVVQVLQGDGQSRYRSSGVRETFGSMTDVLEAFEFLLGKLEDAKSHVERHPEPEQFVFNINLGWKKLDKYYNTLRDSPVYYAAAALHPSLRWDYFDEVWGQQHPGWIDEAKDIVQHLWETEYRDLQITVTSPEGPVVKRRKTTLSSFDRYRNRYRQSQPFAAQADEYVRWQANVSGSDRDVVDPVEYWILKSAGDELGVRELFSATGLMVTPLRNRLDAGTIGLIQTLRSWLRAGIIEDADSILLDDTALEEAVGRACLEKHQE